MTIFKNKWDALLADEIEEPYFKDLCEFLKEEYANNTIYPRKQQVFNALKYTDYDNVSVVILGQDPYHNPNEANGLAFSVNPGIRIPPSLFNIYKEICDDVGGHIPDNGVLVPWAKSGVMLLNAVLTVRAGSANSHRGRGWERFTDKAIELLNEKEEPVIFLLWGRSAAAKEIKITNPIHFVLKAAHPSPLSASAGFFGSRHFSKTNQILKDLNKPQINWQIENLQ